MLSVKTVSYFHFSLSIDFLLSHPKHFFFTQISLPTSFLAYIKPRLLGMCSKSLHFHAFMHFRPRFWGFWKFLGFWDFCEIFGLGYVDLILYAHALHILCILTMFHAFRCVIDYCEMCADRFGLGFYPWCNLNFARHMFMHISCIRYFFSFLLFILLWLCFSLSLSLLDRLRYGT